MSELSISNVINVSVAATNQGINSYNTSNLALVTGEGVVSASKKLTFSSVPTSGEFNISFGASFSTTGTIQYNDSAVSIQVKINNLSGDQYDYMLVTGSISDKELVLNWPGYYGNIPTITIPANTLRNVDDQDVTILVSTISNGWSGGNNRYAFYNSPEDVAKDFGTFSATFAQANAVFSQKPNILNGNGQLIALLRGVQQYTLNLNTVPDAGSFTLSFAGQQTTSLSYNATAGEIQTALRELPGGLGISMQVSNIQVFGALEGRKLFIYLFNTYTLTSTITVGSNSLTTSSNPVTITIVETLNESYGQVITRTQGLVQYFGITPNETCNMISQADILASAAIAAPLNIISFLSSNDGSSIEPGGYFYTIMSSSYQNTRCLYYQGADGQNDVDAVCSRFAAAYASLGLSVNFNGSNTTTTMHLKTLIGIPPDLGMDQTTLNLCQIAGADVYVSIQGAPSVFISGANKFFDQVYNLEWIVGALKVAGFNYLAQTSTKVPQTENGMDGLKGAYRKVCDQAVANQYLAPGTWNSSTTFGNQQLFFNNISQFGYYIYSQPISQQLQAERQVRRAPLVQIAIKEAGAIQESSIIVYVNA
jgi:hypothetical protein